MSNRYDPPTARTVRLGDGESAAGQYAARLFAAKRSDAELNRLVREPMTSLDNLALEDQVREIALTLGLPVAALLAQALMYVLGECRMEILRRRFGPPGGGAP